MLGIAAALMSMGGLVFFIALFNFINSYKVYRLFEYGEWLLEEDADGDRLN